MLSLWTLCCALNPKDFSYTILPQSFIVLSKSGFSNMWTVNFQIFKLVLKKAEEPEIKLPTSAGSSKKEKS